MEWWKEPHYEEVVLDLHDIFLLLNYERASIKRHLRHTKLREVTIGEFSIAKFLNPHWAQGAQPRESLQAEPDLPLNMLLNTIPTSLSHLSSNELETYHWQARNHNGCFTTVARYQHFINLFPEFSRVRVGKVDKDKTRVYSTFASDRFVVGMNLHEPHTVSMFVVPLDNWIIRPTVSAGDDPTMSLVSVP